MKQLKLALILVMVLAAFSCSQPFFDSGDADTGSADPDTTGDQIIDQTGDETGDQQSDDPAETPGPPLPAMQVYDVSREAPRDFTFQTVFPVALDLEVDLYVVDENGRLAGDELPADTTSIFVTLENSDGVQFFSVKLDADGRYDGVVYLPSAPEDVTMDVNAEGFARTSIVIPDMVTLAEVTRVIPLARREGDRMLRDTTPPTGLEDSDGDGVPDVYDAYPDDPNSSFKLSVPAEGKLTIAFEDLFGRANAGDADYNDFVAAYSITEASGEDGITSITIMANAVAKLAGYDHTFGIRIDSFIGEATLSGNYIKADGTEGSYDDVPMTAPAEIVLFENSRNAVGPGKVVNVTLTFGSEDNPNPQPRGLFVNDDGTELMGLPDPPYNPFAIVKNTGHDIHLIGHEPLTELIDSINPDDTFRDGDGFPWALLVPSTWQHPAETENIAIPYPRFTLWRESLGAAYTDWYLYHDLPPAAEPGAYVAGYYNDGTQDVAAYWVNGALNALPVPEGSSGSRANDLYVDGAVVYVAGWYADPTSRNRVAAYWAGGNPVPLTSPNDISEATGIAVDGGTLYVSGKSTSADFLTDTAFYRRGDTRIDLYSGPSSSASTALHVRGGAAYVAGYAPTTVVTRGAAYWVDAAPPVDLSGGLSSQAWDIDVSTSGDVYIAGNVRDPVTANYASVYWTNDSTNVTTLYLDTATRGNYSRAYGIDEFDGTVFTAGHYETDANQFAVYWEGPTLHVLSDGSPTDTANDIAVSGGSIHVVGTVTNGDREIAVVWTDGVQSTLYDSGVTGVNAGASSIAVVAP